MKNVFHFHVRVQTHTHGATSLYTHNLNTTHMCLSCSHTSNPSARRLVNSNQHMDLEQMAEGHSCHNTTSQSIGEEASSEIHSTGQFFHCHAVLILDSLLPSLDLQWCHWLLYSIDIVEMKIIWFRLLGKISYLSLKICTLELYLLFLLLLSVVRLSLIWAV